MIYLIDRVFKIKRALNILINQVKYSGIYGDCFGCKDKDKDKDNDNDSDKDNDSDNDNDKDNDNDNYNDKDNDEDKDKVLLVLFPIYISMYSYQVLL